MSRKFYSLFLILNAALAGLDGFGQGFPAAATNWSLPVGGLKANGTDYGFPNLSLYGSSMFVDDDGSQTWSVTDLNGDGRPDLVVTMEKQGGLYRVFGTSPNRSWRVYYGTATGFASTPTTWALPVGGARYNNIDQGFNALARSTASYHDNGSQLWTTTDINGDAKPDLVVAAEQQNNVDNTFGSASNRFWKVFLNTGTGFAPTSINWTLPAGGRTINGVSYSFNSFSFFGTSQGTNDDNGSQHWSFKDMNGDAKPDLVIVTEIQGGVYSVPGTATSRFWKVFLNTGTGFAPLTTWALPAGGKREYNTNLSFTDLSSAQWNSPNDGSQTWSMLDMNADAKPDLLITSEQQNGEFLTYGTAPNRSWKVFLNSGTSFATTATTWALPDGGRRARGVDFGFNTFDGVGIPNDNIGSQTWAVADLNGDARPDMVITSEMQSGQYSVFGTSAARSWRVYYGTTSGFASMPTTWALPAGGLRTNYTNQSYTFLAYIGSDTDEPGSQGWEVRDMNSDGKLDLLVTGQQQAGKFLTFGAIPNRYWQVYLQSGTGTSVGSSSYTPELALYPNPANEQLQLRGHERNTPYSILDELGRTVQSGRLTEAALDVHMLPAGVYCIRVGLTGSGNRAMRFVKI